VGVAREAVSVCRAKMQMNGAGGQDKKELVVCLIALGCALGRAEDQSAKAKGRGEIVGGEALRAAMEAADNARIFYGGEWRG